MKLTQDHNFSIFYEKYKDAIYKVIQYLSRDSNEVEDIAQEVFINLYRGFSGFSEEKGSFYTWASAIAKNTYFAYRKNRKKELILTENVSLDLFKVKDDFIQDLESRILEEELREIISSLPEPEKSIILLKELNHYTLEKTSQALNISSRTVSRKLLRAYDLLREELEKRKVAL